MEQGTAATSAVVPLCSSGQRLAPALSSSFSSSSSAPTRTSRGSRAWASRFFWPASPAPRAMNSARRRATAVSQGLVVMTVARVHLGGVAGSVPMRLDHNRHRLGFQLHRVPLLVHQQLFAAGFGLLAWAKTASTDSSSSSPFTIFLARASIRSSPSSP